MCGIIGYIGFRNAREVLIEGLKRLEYRGYDSAGIGSIVDGRLRVFKGVGEISNLEEDIPNFKSKIGIGHTRWATHGEVNRENAHPHLSCDKKIAVVHNGIVENFRKLKEELEKKGHKFSSQTDTEVISHLIEEEYRGNLEKAVFSALKKIRGSYAIVAISQGEPNKIVGARKDSPLIIGIGDNENFCASDIPAILGYTNRVIYLEDGDICVLTKDDVKIFDKEIKEVGRRENIVEWNIKDAEKAGFPHFMLKEIYEQANTVQQVLRGRVSEIERSIVFNDTVEKLLENEIDSVHIIGCGTSFYAGLVGKYIIEKLSGVPVHVELSSEYRYFGLAGEKSLILAITQSGETADTLAALKEAKKFGCKTIAVTNVIGSSAARIADGSILLRSGPEIGVAATKTFTSQIIILFLIALKLALIREKIDLDDLYRHIIHLKEIPKMIRTVLEKSDDIIKIARLLKNSNSVFFIGRGVNYPLALEGALKLKEISYIHAEGFAAGELKHGPFALLTRNTPVVAIVTLDDTYDKMLSNIGEIKARDSPVIAIADERDSEIEKHVDYILRFPACDGILSGIPITIILQLLAYHTANLRGCSIDKPRNLAKSVTVE
ncbi:MAG: glutamine--fructose-6-phosphate transaminase (isomerizing) [Thermoplasmata archaeon]|nr:glutamine--fructose-6-phosphate transaminase (isomerizing) [Thermoplasmata archaeon]